MHLQYDTPMSASQTQAPERDPRPSRNFDTRNVYLRDLARAASQHTGVPVYKCKQILSFVIDCVVDCVAEKNQTLSLSEIGRLSTKKQPPRKSNSIAHKGIIEIPERRVPVFKPSRSFRERIARNT